MYELDQHSAELEPAFSRMLFAFVLGIQLVGLFLFDVSSRHGALAGIGYFALVSLAAAFSRRAVFLTAVVATGLILAGFFVLPEVRISATADVLTRSIAIASIWTVTALAMRRPLYAAFRKSFGAKMFQQTAQPESDASDPRGSERILIVDDDVDITDVLSLGLDRLNYNSTAVNDPLEALAMFEKDPDGWDAVVSDQVMPGMLGVELLRELKRIRPDVKTVLCTGYSGAMGADLRARTGVDAFRRKPADAKEIAKILRKLLDNA